MHPREQKVEADIANSCPLTAENMLLDMSDPASWCVPA